MTTRRHTTYVKFLLYLLVIVLLNLAGRTLFFRLDLTAGKSYTLSPVSREVVSTLTEPLTIKVFFTQKLPAPHNGTELYLQDLLKEYALYANDNFNYRFYDVDPETEGISDDAGANRQMAREYGINPVQIQMVENDELKLKQAYMGLVLIHGDIIERIPTLTSTDGLEYRLTTAMQKLNNKVSALLKVKDPIAIKLVLSSSINTVAPYMQIDEIRNYPTKIKEIVERLNKKMYDKLSFSTIDPTAEPSATEKLSGYNLLKLKWPDIPRANITAGAGLIGMLVQYKGGTREIPLLHEIRMPIFGTQYQLAETQEIEEAINASLERLIDINAELGYLSGFGTLEYQGLGPMGPQSGETLNRFNALVSQTYSLKPIDIEKTPVPDGLKCLFIARPTEKLSEYALYQIDQALMRGTNLAIFVDAFKESQPPGQQPFRMPQMPMYTPFDSGLEKLLEHYGLRIKKSIVMDENCYRRRMPITQGGGEQKIYYAPIIKSENIDKSLDFMRDIKGLIAVKVSPLELEDDRIKAQGLSAHKLFSSSDRSWEMRDRINLHPMAMHPPESDADMTSQPLAYLLEGSFTSYFKGKPMPEKPTEKNEDETKESQEKETSPIDKADITSTGGFHEKSPKAGILVVASSDMLRDNLLDEEGQSTNAMFLLNTIDALNGREATAVMRSKTQSYNPLTETQALSKVIIKTVNIAGLPILVVLLGLIVWMRRHSRRKRIQQMFQ